MPFLLDGRQDRRQEMKKEKGCSLYSISSPTWSPRRLVCLYFDLVSHNLDHTNIFHFYVSFCGRNCLLSTVCDTVNMTNNSHTHTHAVHANRVSLLYIIYADHMLTAWMHITSSQSHACVKNRHLSYTKLNLYKLQSWF